ncbi:hypothetical protein [Clostridium beijerinckii]|uniref:Uncharacterized protein n=1 Tax=Clostridium beijerinckii TaxID=1520 RepID=A0A1S9N6X8_CLOBE|nr:hypothetical protein [Clostridium beijerinckii]OOP73188.1 hypothetical protein CBEIBR21_09130 [Clostridium beijerinckii]
MGKSLGIINKLQSLNIKCYKTDRFNLDNELMEPYQDDTGVYNIIKSHESNKNKEFFIDIPQIGYYSLFKYFLDGSRYTYKIADMETADGEYMPIVAGQIGTAICSRNAETKKMKKELLKRKNLVALYNHINEEDYNDIKKVIENCSINNVKFYSIKYNTSTSKNKERPENAAIAKILSEMHDMEIAALEEMVTNRKLGSDKMLMLDGSLQFLDGNINDELFTFVIGISKSFNPNQRGMFQAKEIHIATALTQLKYGQRTPVLKHEIKGCNRVIGTWYLRIRPENLVKNPLDGIIKVEKIAVNEEERELGFDTDMINTISQALLCERNSTCHGRDSRWCNHLYPIYLTEKMLKESFLNEKVFLNIV